jgi:hypothetical protein
MILGDRVRGAVSGSIDHASLYFVLDLIFPCLDIGLVLCVLCL